MNGKNEQFFMVAKTYQGLEEVLASELQMLGAHEIHVLNGGVLFRGDNVLMYACNLRLRTATRVLVRIDAFNARNEQNYFRSIQNIEWSAMLGLKDSISVDVSATSEIFPHASYVAMKTREGIADQVRKKTGRNPNVNVANPTFRVHVHIFGQECSVYLDSGCEGLQWRGWRKGKEDGRFSDALTAGCILLSGWHGEPAFIDPNCGTGQACAEAAMISANIAPGLTRESFAFQRWKDYNADAFKAQKSLCVGAERNMAAPVIGWNRSPMEIGMAQRQFSTWGISKLLQFEKAQISRAAVPATPGMLFIRTEEEKPTYFTELGALLKARFSGWQVVLVGPDVEGFKRLGLPVAKRHFILDDKHSFQWVRLQP